MEERKPLIAGNWKMNKTVDEAIETAQEIARAATSEDGPEVMIAPPFTALYPVSQLSGIESVKLGAQNMFYEKSGAYTGEISGEMLTSIRCEYVIIGHSERRQLFGETDEDVRRKIERATGIGLRPVMCIGETESEREAEKTFSVLDKQLDDGLKAFSPEMLSGLVIAYEPVWAIGTGKTATSEQAQAVHAYLRGRVREKFGDVLAGSLRILYGGSVKPANISELMQAPDIDGALIGGASLDAETFIKIIRYTTG